MGLDDIIECFLDFGKDDGVISYLLIIYKFFLKLVSK